MNIFLRQIFFFCALCSAVMSYGAFPVDMSPRFLTYLNDGEACVLIETADTVYLPGTLSHRSLKYMSNDAGAFNANLGDSYRNDFNVFESIPVEDILNISFFYPYTSAITEIDCDNPNWDNVYVTPRGYFALRYDDEQSNLGYDEVRYMSFDGYDVSIFFSKDNGIPLSMSSKDFVINFYCTPHISYNVDVEGYLDEGQESDCLCDISLSMDVMSDVPREVELCGTPFTCVMPDAKIDVSEIGAAMRYPDISPDNPFGARLYLVAYSLSQIYDQSSYPLVSDLESVFYEVSLLKSCEKCGENENMAIPKGENGIGAAIGVPGPPKGNTKITSNIVVETQRSRQIKQTSAILTGAIRCHSPRFRTEGTYGILVDTDKTKLVKGKAQYDFPATQGDMKLAFDVVASGLEPNTDYYYRAYYKLNNAKSDLSIKFDNRDPNTISDKVATETYGKIKAFTTLPPDISGVWYFVNEVFADNLYFDLQFDRRKGKYVAVNDFYGVFDLEVEVFRNRRVELSFTSHFSGAFFTGYFNEDYSSANGTGSSTYMGDPTPFTMSK